MLNRTAQAQAKFEIGIALALHSWPALTIAVQNQWGGHNSADKRDWLAGAIAQLFESNPETDGEDVADVLLQVMEDEFEAVVEDDSEIPVAATIMKIRVETSEGNFSTVNQMYEKWEEKGDAEAPAVKVQSQSDDEDSVDGEDWDEDGDGDGYGDTEMADAPAVAGNAAPKKEKPPPEVDEDGFTKVVGKKRR